MKNKFRIYMCIISIYSTVINNAYSNEIHTNSAMLQTIDKVTGRAEKINIPINTKTSLGDFTFIVRDCRKNPPEETTENFAFLDVSDKIENSRYNIFRGWVLSSTPELNAIEHPIYDVSLIECSDTDINTDNILSEDELSYYNSLPKFSQTDEVNIVKKEKKEIKLKKVDEYPDVIKIKDFLQNDIDIEETIIKEKVIYEEADFSNKPRRLVPAYNITDE